MNDPETLLKPGIAAIQAGDLEEGRRLLEQVVAEDPEREQAWLWLSVAVDDVEERRACLRRVLEINHDNEEAWRSLKALALTPPARTAQDDTIRTEVSEFPCPGCQSDLRYSPRHGALACSYCGKVVKVPKDSARPQSFPLDGLPATREAQEEWVGRQIHDCQSCGANTAFSSRRGSLECPFCGSSSVVKPPSDIPLIPPQAVIPFQFEKEEAEGALRHWLGGGWLRPGDLDRRAVVERLHGVYIPFWLFDGLSRVYWSDADEGRQESARAFRDVPVCASLSLTEEMAQGVEPFELEALAPYHPEYLAGWPAEVYQIALADASVQVRQRIRREVEKLFGRIEQVNFTYVDWKLALLPVYLGAYRYEGRLYLFAVNGQTGRTFGKAPYSVGRVALIAAGAVLLGVVLILMLIGLWPYLVPLLEALAGR